MSSNPKKEMLYDVFICYRRDKGLEIARILQMGLERKGLRVFLDLEKLRDGKFNEKLYESIESSQNLIFILTEGALDRCFNEGDWVRNELEHAIASGVNMVPVAPYGHNRAFPEKMPPSLEALRDYQISLLDLNDLFNETVDRIISDRLKGVEVVDDEKKQEAEAVFLERAKECLGVDGHGLDGEKRQMLLELAKEFNISPIRREKLLGQAEQALTSQLTAAAPEESGADIGTAASYDVFISYRRDGAASDARMMYDRLTNEGYSVSFDMDTLKNGNFNEELLHRVLQCKNFVILLSKGCFARTLSGCKREDDWLRIELATALFNKKNIIAVMLPGFEFPEKLPPDIDAIRFKNGPKYDMYYLDSFYDRLKKDFLVGVGDSGRKAEPAPAEKLRRFEDESFADEIDDGYDAVFGDDAAYWREETEGFYHSISRVLPYEDLKMIDDLWNEAEDHLRNGDRQTASRRYMKLFEILSSLQPVFVSFVTRMIGDGIDTCKPEWFEQMLARAQAGDCDYMYDAGMFYNRGLGVAKDKGAAFRWFERAAKKGHVQAMAAVGAAYATGDGVELDYATAKEFLLKAAQEEAPLAYERLGYLYQHGYGVEEDRLLALEYYKKAAESKNSAAMVALGRMIETDQNSEPDLKKAVSWYRAAADLDNPDGQRLLAECLFSGHGVEKDPDAAMKWLTRSVNQDNADAVALLGKAYEEGWGVGEDKDKAEKLYRRAFDMGSAAGKTYLAELEANVQYRKGMKCLEGSLGEARDFIGARVWFEKAAAQGNDSAMEQLGFLYQHGLGGDMDIPKAKELYEAAAQKGNAAALAGLGQLYFRGTDGIKKDYVRAKECFCKAVQAWREADENSRWKVIYAFFYLGRIHAEGLGVPVNLMQGLRFLITGAHNGNLFCARLLARIYSGKANDAYADLPKSEEKAKFWNDRCLQMEKSIRYDDDGAMFSLGLVYRRGDVVSADGLEMAFYWTEKAARLGNYQAMHELAWAYQYGKGVIKDLALALKYDIQAAERGYMLAQNSVSWAYYKGIGTEQNAEKAFEWGLKAAKNGSKGAMETLYRMYLDGFGVEKNEAEALKWLQKAVEGNGASPRAMATLGECYENGSLGLAVDLEKALGLYRKAAEEKNVRGIYDLGRCLWKGIGTTQDTGEALRWLVQYTVDNDQHYDDNVVRLLGEMYYGNGDFALNVIKYDALDPQSNREALRTLGYKYSSGVSVEKNSERALECIAAAADRGDKIAQNSLGWWFYKGDGVPRNAEKAFEWTMKAVNNGNPNGMETLFRMYRDGDGVKKDEAEALVWLRRASDGDEASACAMSEMGECYEFGLLGVAKDEKTAFEYYKRCANKSKCPGRYNLGRCYLRGIGTEPDAKQGIYWLTKAADTEDSDDGIYQERALRLLEEIFRNGEGVEADAAKADEWAAKLKTLKNGQ